MDTMNCQRAFKILEIDETIEVDVSTVRKQYKYMALKWHPDKNPAANAADRYREIKDAQDFLLEGNLRGSQNVTNNYANMASSFFETLYNNEHLQRQIFHPLLMKVVGMCEEKTLEFMFRLDADRASKLLAVLETYKMVLHLSDDFFEKVKQHKQGSEYRHILLNPNIDDLMQCNVCRLEDEGIIAPLWHSLLEYEKERLIVHCLPELPTNMWIDEDDNTLNVEVCDSISNIWNLGVLNFSIGTLKKQIEMEHLKMRNFQIVELPGEGIPVPNADDVFCAKTLGLVRVHLNIIEFHKIDLFFKGKMKDKN